MFIVFLLLVKTTFQGDRMSNIRKVLFFSVCTVVLWQLFTEAPHGGHLFQEHLAGVKLQLPAPTT